jgi:hypothetical protein
MSWNNNSCEHCGQWEMIRDDAFLCWKAPKGYPLTLNCHDGNLQPRKLNYDDLCFATRRAHHHVLCGEWSRAECELFLSSYCINKKAALNIVRNALNMRALNALAIKEDAVDDYEALLERKRK